MTLWPPTSNDMDGTDLIAIVGWCALLAWRPGFAVLAFVLAVLCASVTSDPDKKGP